MRADQQRAVQDQLGAVGGPRHLGGAVSDHPGHLAAAAGRRRLRRVPADRRREDRRSLQPQPPHRAEADGAVSGLLFTLRPYEPADEEAAIELWRRTWQQHYPQIDFDARVEWWRDRWRTELVPVADHHGRGGRRQDGRLRHRRSEDFRSRPDRGGAGGLGRRRRRGADRRGQAALAERPRPARQQGQFPRHPLLREAGLRRSPARRSTGAPARRCTR